MVKSQSMFPQRSVENECCLRLSSVRLDTVLELDLSFLLNVEAEEWVCMEAHGQLLLCFFVALLCRHQIRPVLLFT